jgi:PilZ domain
METTNSGQEKRGSKRVHKNLVVKYSISADSGPRKWDLSIVQDIGEKGVSFTVSQEIPSGTMIDMIIKIPLRPFEWFDFTGRLVGCEEFKEQKEDATFRLKRRAESINT